MKKVVITGSLGDVDLEDVVENSAVYIAEKNKVTGVITLSPATVVKNDVFDQLVEMAR